MKMIETAGLSKKFGDFYALDSVTLVVEKGEFFGLFGPNGAGKTTLLKILTGQIDPTSGGARVMGTDVVQNPMEVKERIGIVPEVEAPPSYLTGREFLYFVGKVREVDDLDGKIDRWLDFFDLREAESIVCKDLSKGMRQKLMLASAFIHEPALLFLDEPFINLDPIYQKKVRDFLLGFVKNGGTIFMCTHILEIAERLCNRSAIINRGRIIAQGRIDELRKHDDEALEEIFLRLVNERD